MLRRTGRWSGCDQAARQRGGDRAAVAGRDHGLVGFGRLTTPEAWLSTWSGLTSRADFAGCAPGVTIPTLFIELTGDQAAFPADTRAMIGALGADDLTTATVRGLHFGGAIAAGEPTGNELAAAEIVAWLGQRHELSPPG
jgi:ribosome modulation factor